MRYNNVGAIGSNVLVAKGVRPLVLDSRASVYMFGFAIYPAGPVPESQPSGGVSRGSLHCSRHQACHPALFDHSGVMIWSGAVSEAADIDSDTESSRVFQPCLCSAVRQALRDAPAKPLPRRSGNLPVDRTVRRRHRLSMIWTAGSWRPGPRRAHESEVSENLRTSLNSGEGDPGGLQAMAGFGGDGGGGWSPLRSGVVPPYRRAAPGEGEPTSTT